jgi:catechol 2,3-dioxygenase-like lactoylglutathione lyase family enzyme
MGSLVCAGCLSGRITADDRALGQQADGGGYGTPMTVALFAGIRVRDLTAARAWYERLLGEPSFFPNAVEIVWTLADDRSLYIEEDPRRAGSGLITVFVDDLDAITSEISSRGLEPAERETYSNGVRKATYRDGDGNEIGFGGPPRNH